MNAIWICLAVLAAASSPSQLSQDVATYDQSLLEELREMAPATVDEARAAAEAYRAERWQEAFERYQRVSQAAPRFSHALRRQCVARAQLGDRAEALTLCRRALVIAAIGENEIALATTLAKKPGGQGMTPAERQEVVRLANSAMKKKPGDVSVAMGACQISTLAGDAPLLQSCSSRLAQIAPEEGSTHIFQTIAALNREQLAEARTHLAKARAAGIDPKLAAHLGTAIEKAVPPYQRWGLPAGKAIAVWAVLFLLLIGLGVALSAATMRTAVRMARAPQGSGSSISGLLRRLYSTVLWLSCTYYYISIPLVLLAVLALGAGVLYAFVAMGRIPVKLVLLLALLVLVTTWAILKSLWAGLFRSGGSQDPGLRLDTAAHPGLTRALESVAGRLGTRTVDAVFLTPGTEVAVFERGSMLKQLSGRTERCLILGVGVLDGMTQGELKAILAHEYGHLVNRDTAGGGFALAVRRSLMQMAKSLAEGGAATWYNPAWWFVNGFYRAFLRVSQGASRLQEILADRWAALAYGGRNFARGLEHVIERSIHFDAHAQSTLQEVIDGQRALANLYRYTPSAPLDEKAMRGALDQALTAEPSPYDSHPCPRDRIAWVGPLTAGTALEPADSQPAWDLFSDREAVERQMTDQIRAAVAANHGVAIPVAPPAAEGNPADSSCLEHAATPDPHGNGAGTASNSS